jgi:hypothetical protein
MNNRIKEIAQNTFKNLKIDSNRPDLMIDTYVLELSKALIFECSDVLREKAKNETDPVAQAMLKVSAVDLLDHFGL